MTTYFDRVYDPTLGSVFGKALGKFGQRVKAVWENGDEDAANTVKIIEADDGEEEKKKQNAEINATEEEEAAENAPQNANDGDDYSGVYD